MFWCDKFCVSKFARIACNRVRCTRTGEHGSPLHYFGNYGSFIRFISIIVFVSLLGGRPMNAPTVWFVQTIKMLRSGIKVFDLKNYLHDLGAETLGYKVTSLII